MNRLNRVQFQKFYHGSSVGPEIIMKEGLKAQNPLEHVRGYTKEDEESNPTAVYVTEHREEAENYGDHLYSVELPEEHSKWVWNDWNMFESHRGWADNIPPHFIRYEGPTNQEKA